MPAGGDTPPGLLGRSFRSAVGRESTTFGFSIMVTVTFGVAQSRFGSPSSTALLLYAAGAALSFTLLEGGLSHGFRRPMPQHRSEVVTFGTGMNIVSVVGGVLASMGAAELVGGELGWAVLPFVAGIVYLVLESLETALGERVLKARGDERASEVES